MSGEDLATTRPLGDRSPSAVEHSLFMRAPVGLMTLEPAGRVVAHNPVLATWLGVPEEEAAGSLIGRNAFDWLTPGARARCEQLLTPDTRPSATLREVILDARTLTGEVIPVILNADIVLSPQGNELVHVALIDATERSRFERALLEARRSTDRANEQLHQLQEQLRHQALHDALTGLANETLLEEQLSRMLVSSTRSEQPCAVLYLDLDGFRAVNKQCGHAAGDELLRIMADRLRQACPTGGLVSRLGGDEFAIALGPVTVPELDVLAERLLAEARAPFGEIADGLPISASIGAVVWVPQPGEGAPPARELLAAADQAMYRAKLEGKNRVARCEWGTLHE